MMIMHGGISDKGFCSFVVLKFSSVNAVKNVFNYFSTTQTPTLRWTLNVTDKLGYPTGASKSAS